MVRTQQKFWNYLMKSKKTNHRLNRFCLESLQ
ncbi:hypothetical protein Bhyg_02959 [Pseudolycoriella hygida]|uniref:Uncharacterized protein n=1 Tax=Pseudolycoriella hygida TaxID=35572 RepID=A0A9Q0NDL2_9DIPT|nr:hypothetical protein Bhyg_02959 [Pseudolycoriella hygida]